MERLKKLRIQKGLFQKDVAAYLGVDRTTYVKYESGANEPDNATLIKLSNFFGVSVDYLLGRIDPATSKRGEIMTRNRMKELRISNNETQSDIADFLGVSRTSYLKYENGLHEPSFETLIKLANHFNVSVDFLLGKTDQEEKSTTSRMFYDIFRRLCDENGITPTKASEEIGFSKGSVSYWKKKYMQGEDAKPDSYTTAKIADYFGVSVDYLLGRTNDATDGDPVKIEEKEKFTIRCMFCENLKKVRLEKKMSQRALAEKIFISQQAYAKYELGTASPNPEMLTAISDVLGVSVDYLLGREGDVIPIERFEMNRINELRKKNGYSQQKLAEALNVHQTAISQWETGRTYPGIEMVSQMAQLFDVSLDYLLGRIDPATSKEGEITTQNRMKELRNKANITQAELAAYLNVAQNTLSYWEQGKYEPNSETLLKIANYFGCTIEEILGEDIAKKPAEGELSQEEFEKLKRFRRLPPEKQKQIEDYLDFLLSQQGDK